MILTIVARNITEESLTRVQQAHDTIWESTFWYCYSYNKKIYIHLKYPGKYPYDLQIYASKKELKSFFLYRLFFMGLLVYKDINLALGKNKVRVYKKNKKVFFVVNGIKHEY